MRVICIFVLICASVQVAVGQTNSNVSPSLATDPGDVFNAASPYYNFSDSLMKPWHLKASYQLYDKKGKPAEQGTFEYWWLTTGVYRTAWTRPGATQTDWHTSNGKHAYFQTGGQLQYFEHKLESVLLSPLPSYGDLEPIVTSFKRTFVGPKDNQIPCIMVIPKSSSSKSMADYPGLFPTYCFDPSLPILRIQFSMGAAEIRFNQIARMQGKYLAREILILEGTRKILTATVDSVTGLNPDDGALTPSPDAHFDTVGRVKLASEVFRGQLLNKVTPVYPSDAKNAHLSGTVILRAIIGRDGAIHDLRVVSTPAPSLAASALWAVSQWEYKPYLLKGEPVEVETTINVIYTLGVNDTFEDDRLFPHSQ